ncbi:hypothetical protein F8388_021652 [Cannabis sativa]|uniref:Exocyst subunit Exo70 family protein n=1 Tax=Cannabis sativa TaxID=3483 RepID=A0A7J6DXR7_CANSA|nr:hypothetical protein F8388_021652 [Cannabis sativa]
MAKNLEAARNLLKASLDKSKQVGIELDETGSRLREINQRLVPLEVEFREVYNHRTTYVRVKNQVDCVIGPIAAIPRVYKAIIELEKAIAFSEPHTELFSYLFLIRRLEEGLKFLGSHSLLAIRWLEGVFELFEGDELLMNLKDSSGVLKKLHGMEESCHIQGGLLSNALDKLEIELGKLFALTSSLGEIHAIMERLKANGRLEKCVSLFVEIRVSIAKRRLQALGLDYLDDVKISNNVEIYIEQWSMHLELALKQIFDHEYKLSKKVFEKIGSNIWMTCFARISIESGILSFIQFGNEVANMKNDPIKLLTLLDIFKVLNNLRMDFNRLYGSSACIEIQNPIRDLVKRVVENAYDIFQQLPFQVGSQRRFSPPQDGSVPRLVKFITNYCNQLLGEDYKATLIEVLTINQQWKQEIYEENLLSIQFHNIMKEIGLNLDSWSKAYSDTSLSYLFMMNNHCHFTNLRGTNLGDMMGETWLTSHDQYKDYYATLYFKETWEKTLLPLLTQKGTTSLISVSISRLKAFNEAFKESYEKQSNWVISDENLRQKMRGILVEKVVTTYRCYIQSYKALVEQDSSAGKYVKHTENSLESKLSSLFQPKLATTKYSSSSSSSNNNNKHVHLIGKLKNVVTNQLRFTLTAM